MRTIHRRIRKIEDRLLSGTTMPQRLWAVCKPDWGLALDADRCVDILGECGFLSTKRFGVVNFHQVPDGLNAKQLERFLRKEWIGDSLGPGGARLAVP